MRESNLLRRGADGELRLSPAAMRRLGTTLLRDAADRLSARPGARESRLAGRSEERRVGEERTAGGRAAHRPKRGGIGSTAASMRRPARGGAGAHVTGAR